MRFHKTLISLILVTGLMFAVSAWAHQKGVGPSGAGPRPNAVRPYVACAAAMLTPPGVQQITVAPGLSPAHAYVAASLPRHGGVKPPLRYAALKGGSTTAGPPASAKRPLNQVQVITLLAAQVPSHRITALVQQRGIDFEPADDYLQEVRLAGGEDELIAALKGAKVTKPVTLDPAAQARQVEIRRHVARGAEHLQRKQYADAETEFRAAVRLDPRDSDLRSNLGCTLDLNGNSDGAIAEYRRALRLNPENEHAHFNLGSALGAKGDWDGEIAEEREALRLNPDNDYAHLNLGEALAHKGDREGAITEYREALRLNPKIEAAHVYLGTLLAFWFKGDWDGAIGECREALRLSPQDDQAHACLGSALVGKGDDEGARAEYREALRLNPNNEAAHAALGWMLGQNCSLVAEWCDWDASIAEEREALRLDPNDAYAHFNLGIGLQRKDDPEGAFKEFRAAYMLDPKNTAYKQSYERLLQQVNK